MAGSIVDVKKFEDYTLQIYDVFVTNQWYNGSYVETGAKDTISGDFNTSLIVSVQTGGSYAAYVCDVATNGGKTDWYLPSINELTEMYQSGLLTAGQYWSSTEFDGTLAYSLNGTTGVISQTDKADNTLVIVKTRKQYTTDVVTIDRMKLQSKDAPILRGGEYNADEDVYKMLGGVYGTSKNSKILSDE